LNNVEQLQRSPKTPIVHTPKSQTFLAAAFLLTVAPSACTWAGEGPKRAVDPSTIDKVIACAPLLGNEKRARKIAALLAVRELAQKKGGVSVEGQETIDGNDYKVSVYEDGVQIIRPVRETPIGTPPGMPGQYCVQVEEISR
jgi:hypothetical protein